MSNEQILSFIKQHGPVLPVNIARLLGTNILFASAHLSELASKGLVRISHIKVGGSPLYYLPGQEQKLLEYVDKLPEKERRALELLKQRQLLCDSELPPVVRYALRQIKDFAKPFEVKIGNEKHLFWRWYLTPMEALQRLIKEKYVAKAPQLKQPEPLQQQAPAFTQTKPLTTKSQMSAPKPQRSGALFLDEVTKFFEAHKITVLQQEVLKKGKHAWYIVKVPTTIGNVTYYAEAKQKKRITEADLSEAYVRGSNKRLPVLYITNGKPTKSTQEALSKDFKSIVIKTISD